MAVATGTGYTLGSATSASVTVNDDDPTDATAPTLSTAAVDGATLTLTYNEALDEDSTPATTAFSVAITPGTGLTPTTFLQTPTNVDVSGTAVTLTLGTAAMSGQVVTMGYTKGTNPIQDAAGNDAANLTNPLVTNNTALVSNLDVAGSSQTSFNSDYAQAFTTGSRATSQGSVELDLELNAGRTPPPYAVSIHAANAAGDGPGTSVGTLTKPSIPAGEAVLARFAAPSSGITLAGGTTYFVVIDVTGGTFQQRFGLFLRDSSVGLWSARAKRPGGALPTDTADEPTMQPPGTPPARGPRSWPCTARRRRRRCPRPP